jgi:hypothetical protein
MICKRTGLFTRILIDAFCAPGSTETPRSITGSTTSEQVIQLFRDMMEVVSTVLSDWTRENKKGEIKG